MDDVKVLLPDADHKAINNVQMYLQIMNLSEITDASGTTILPHAMEPGPSSARSTLKWPNQPKPTAVAWKHWRRALQHLYLRTDSTHLTQPLKEWLGPTFNLDWQWDWRINPTTLELHHREGHRWTTRRPVLTKRTYIAYDLHQHHRATTTDPELLPPATPSIDASQTFLIIQTPIYPVYHPPVELHWTSSDLLERLSTPPQEWASQLWHRVRPMAPIDHLLQAIHSNTHLLLCSDASVDAAKHSCCAWAIYGRTMLWKGEGVVPGNCDDTYSGRSEAFGILTALTFLNHYIQQYPHPQLQKQYTLTVYCDNGGTITQAMKYSTASELFPNQTISDDYDVYAEIAQAVTNLPQFSINFVHVKGHQNRTNKKQPLTLPAQLNIDCDERATSFLRKARQVRTNDNLTLPSSYPHVCIHGTIIVRELTQALRHAASTPDYRAYLKEKFQWTDTDCDDINWVSLKFALRKLSPADHTRAHKFLHDWLPLKGASHTTNATASPLCPQCKRDDETTWHFWECQHPERTTRFQKLQRDLTALHAQYNLDPHMFQLLWQGLQAIRQDTTIDDQYETYPEPLRKLFQAQKNIGWDQLYYGRISIQWAHHVTIDSQYKTNGEVFYSKVIGLVWSYIFDCWTQRNHHLHSTATAPPDYQVLKDQVRQIIETSNNDPALAMAIPPQTVEQIMQRPIPMIRSWAQRSARHMQNYLTAAHKRAVLHTHDIRNFFKPKQDPDLRPP